jgi:hypothetical protein
MTKTIYDLVCLWKHPEGSFLNRFSRLRKKLAPTPVLDLALLAPRREVGDYVSFKTLASDAEAGS